MNTLIYNAHTAGANLLYVKISSDLIPKSEHIVKVREDLLEEMLHRQNIGYIRKYLRGYVASRLIAYEKKKAYCEKRIRQLSRLQVILDRNPSNLEKFYNTVVAHEQLLINSLPYLGDISHHKVNAIIQNCKKQQSKYDQTRTISTRTGELHAAHRLGTHTHCAQ